MFVQASKPSSGLNMGQTSLLTGNEPSAGIPSLLWSRPAAPWQSPFLGDVAMFLAEGS